MVVFSSSLEQQNLLISSSCQSSTSYSSCFQVFLHSAKKERPCTFTAIQCMLGEVCIYSPVSGASERAVCSRDSGYPLLHTAVLCAKGEGVKGVEGVGSVCVLIYCM